MCLVLKINLIIFTMRFPLLVLTLLISLIVLAAQGFATESMIPSSDKSQNAYRRVAPTLIRTMQKKGLSLGDPVFIRIFKQEKTLEVWIRQGLTYTLFKSYSICHHSGDIGPKIREGDKQSPEGFYTVGADQLNPNSSYHLSFNLGFPNEYDRSHNRTGSLLMIHGRCSSAGCFAMTNFRMDEIYAIVESAIIAGQSQVPVHIFPFKMTPKKMAAHRNSKWIAFWENIKEGYDYFEGHHAPPVVVVQDKRYQFITFRPLLFGGTLPPPVPRLTVATMKRSFKLQETPVPSETSPKRQHQLLAKVDRTTPSAPNLLGQGD
ncbi:hypothetical protein UWK_02341 [Desulfocapsa sulfexigens DSM 10523]|uniref:L,D-TPase catalytic domain-containing protein n=2 Tax=Desulfocapsa TaxID=53318 RepID=M1PR74_DESSD|nr:hypothetical protein UWK_02341 [Desulfocapsa sulfexigens DSM 10523]